MVGHGIEELNLKILFSASFTNSFYNWIKISLDDYKSELVAAGSNPGVAHIAGDMTM